MTKIDNYSIRNVDMITTLNVSGNQYERVAFGFKTLEKLLKDEFLDDNYVPFEKIAKDLGFNESYLDKAYRNEDYEVERQNEIVKEQNAREALYKSITASGIKYFETLQMMSHDFRDKYFPNSTISHEVILDSHYSFDLESSDDEISRLCIYGSKTSLSVSFSHKSQNVYSKMQVLNFTCDIEDPIESILIKFNSGLVRIAECYLSKSAEDEVAETLE